MAQTFTGHTMADIENLRKGKSSPLKGMFRGTQYITGEQLAEERANEQALKLQELKNRGLVDVAKTTGESDAEQQRLRNIGMRDVTGMEQAGQTARINLSNLGAVNLQKLKGSQAYDIANMQTREEARQADLANKLGIDKLNFLKSQEPFRQYTTLQELENKAAESGILKQQPLDMGYREYQRKLANPEMAFTEDSIRKKLASGMDPTKINFNDSEISFLRNNMPGIIPEKPKQINDQVTYDVNTNTYTNVPTRETNESLYGSNPSLKDIWAIDEARKRQKEVERKKQWTVPY